MAEKVETIDQLEAHLSKYAAAYRKSYKICRSTHLSPQIFAGILGCGAVLALVPAVPISCGNCRGSSSWYKCCCK